MSTQTDVLASAAIIATGQLTDALGNNLARCRLRGFYVIGGAGAGTVVLRDGGAGGPIRLTLNTVGSATAPVYMLLPGEGMLFRTNVHATLTTTGSFQAFYS